jgi:hypothetical protein
MSQPLKSRNQKRVHDRDEKDDRCHRVERLLLNPGKKFAAESWI